MLSRKRCVIYELIISTNILCLIYITLYNIFFCQLIMNEIVIDGQGLTKKKAEQDASKNTLKYYNVLT